MFEMPGSIIPQRFPIGGETVLRQIDAATLRNFYETWSAPHRLVLVTGNVDLSLEKTPPREQILAVYNDSRNTSVRPTAETKRATFPYLQPALTAAPVKAYDYTGCFFGGLPKEKLADTRPCARILFSRPGSLLRFRWTAKFLNPLPWWLIPRKTSGISSGRLG